MVTLNIMKYRVNKKILMHFIFKLVASLSLELDNSHVYSQQNVVTIVRKKSSMQISIHLFVLTQLVGILTLTAK